MLITVSEFMENLRGELFPEDSYEVEQISAPLFDRACARVLAGSLAVGGGEAPVKDGRFGQSQKFRERALKAAKSRKENKAKAEAVGDEGPDGMAHDPLFVPDYYEGEPKQ